MRYAAMPIANRPFPFSIDALLFSISLDISHFAVQIQVAPIILGLYSPSIRTRQPSPRDHIRFSQSAAIESGTPVEHSSKPIEFHRGRYTVW